MKHLRSYRKFESVYYSNLIKESALDSENIQIKLNKFIKSPKIWTELSREDFQSLAKGELPNTFDEGDKDEFYPNWTNEDFQTVCDIMDIMIRSGLVEKKDAIYFVSLFYKHREKLREEIGTKDLFLLPWSESIDMIHKVIPKTQS